GSVECRVGILIGGELHAVHRQYVIANVHVHAGSRQRRAKLGVPALSIEDPRYAVTALTHLQVGAKHSHVGWRNRGQITTAHEAVTDRYLASHPVQQVGEIRTVRHVLNEW